MRSDYTVCATCIMPHATVYGSVICLHRESRACCMRPRDRDTRTRRLKVVVSAVARHPLLLSAQPPHGALWGERAPPSQCSAQRALSASFTVPSAARACGEARRAVAEHRGLGARSTKSSRARAFWQAHRAPPAARPRRSCSSSGAAHRARGSPPRCRTGSSNWAPTKQSQGSGR